MDKKGIKNGIRIGGAIAAYLIGSGFATGQEILQYFTSYGFKGFLAAAISLITYSYLCVSFLKLGKEKNLTHSQDIFTYYCGEKFGRVFEFTAFTYLILQVIVFFTGAGAVLNQHYGFPQIAGSAIMAIICMLTALLGLKKLVDVIGSIGVVLVVTVFSMAIYFLSQNPHAIFEGNQIVKTMDIIQPSPHWPVAGFLYASFMSLGLAAFLPLVGQTSNSQKENVLGGFLGAGALLGSIALVSLSFLTDIGNIGQELIPMLYVAKYISPILGTFFAIIILAGIFTGAAPMYWNFCSRIFNEKTKKFKIFVIVLGCIGLAFGSILPFDRVLNIVYVAYGYVGTVFILFVIARQIKEHKSKKGCSEVRTDNLV